MKISVIGAGKLGLCMTAIYASCGHEVVCVDINKNLIEKLKNGECPIIETDLEETLDEGFDNITFATEFDLIKDTEITFIIVPTPSKSDGSFSNKYVLSSIESICSAIKDKKGYHLIVVVSTVMPQSCTDVFIPAIERSAKKIGEDIGIVYNPEFIALGEVIKGMKYPDTLLIGESDKKAGDLIEKFHRMTLDPVPPIHRMSLNNAELAKIGLNCYITMKISYANTIAEICESMPTGNAYDVLGSIGEDKRVGNKYLKPGLGYSGVCFPRDCRAFINNANKSTSICMLQSATDATNIRHNERYAKKAKELLGDGKKKVAILGVTYKPNTPIIEESAALTIIKELKEYSIIVYDPMASYKGIGIQVDSVEKALDDADLCVICTPWGEFKDITPNTFLSKMKKPVILDCWGIYDRERYEEIDIHTLGISET